MTSLAKLAAGAADIPQLVHGLRTPGSTVHMPHRYGAHLAQWAEREGITLQADVAATALCLRSGLPDFHGHTAPLGRFTRDEQQSIQPDEPTPTVTGWRLD